MAANKIKKAQTGVTKSRTVEKSPDGIYKLITKEKSGPNVKSKSVKEKRTLKGFLKGAPKSSGVINPTPMLNIQNDDMFRKAKSGTKLRKHKRK